MDEQIVHRLDVLGKKAHDPAPYGLEIGVAARAGVRERRAALDLGLLEQSSQKSGGR
jgi:hypothetical protein